MIDKRGQGGFTLVEFLAVLIISSTLLFLGLKGLNSIIKRAEIRNGLRLITSRLNQTRYDSIHLNKKLKFTIDGDRIIILSKTGGSWMVTREIKLSGIKAVINRSPVFHPDGMVSPLCSIYVSNRHYRYRITLSIAGRLKVTKML